MALRHSTSGRACIKCCTGFNVQQVRLCRPPGSGTRAAARAGRVPGRGSVQQGVGGRRRRAPAGVGLQRRAHKVENFKGVAVSCLTA
jgi:hypothetical protein